MIDFDFLKKIIRGHVLIVTFRSAGPMYFAALFLILSCTTFAEPAKTAGFSNFTHGAGPMGVANASVAHSEGISSIYYNPALQLNFEDVNVDFGVTLVFPKKELESASAMQTYESKSTTYTPAHFASSYRISDNTSLAMAINNSFGLGSDFPEDTVFRYITTSSELTTWDLNPSIAYRIHQRAVLSAGLRGVSADATLEQMIPLQAFGLPDGRQKFNADGTGYGWNVGATFSLSDQWTIGASYRSEIDIDLSGNVRYDLPQAAPQFLSNVFPSTSAAAEFTLPAQFFVGVAYRPSSKWVFEAAARNEKYSCYESLTVQTASPVAGRSSMVIPKNWQDVWAYMVGASYQTNAGYRLSAGYLFDENPVPDETFEPGTSGLDKHTLTMGIAKEFRKVVWRISYAIDLYEDRTINNEGMLSVLNGTHSQENQSLAFSLSWHF